MNRSALPSTERSTVWLADLIEATEAVAASADLCDPALVTAFSHRLAMAADVRAAVRYSARTAWLNSPAGEPSRCLCGMAAGATRRAQPNNF